MCLLSLNVIFSLLTVSIIFRPLDIHCAHVQSRMEKCWPFSTKLRERKNEFRCTSFVRISTHNILEYILLCTLYSTHHNKEEDEKNERKKRRRNIFKKIIFKRFYTLGKTHSNKLHSSMFNQRITESKTLDNEIILNTQSKET